MSELFKLLTDFLFRKGYLVSLQKNGKQDIIGIKIKFNGAQPVGDIRRHGFIRLKKDTNILGLLEPQNMLNQGTQDWDWTEIGNIHNPELLELLVKVVHRRCAYDPKDMLPFRSNNRDPLN
jgi:hypothetical protein